MTPADLDALVARLHTAADDRAMTDYGVCNLLTEAAAALAELREENALMGHPPAQIQKLERRAERVESSLSAAMERIAALEAERDALKAERADLIKINNGWAHEWDAMREQVEEMRKVIEAAKANRETLSEIAGSKSLTATPTQFYQHLQRIAAKATAGPFDDLLAALDKEQK